MESSGFESQQIGEHQRVESHQGNRKLQGWIAFFVNTELPILSSVPSGFHLSFQEVLASIACQGREMLT